MNWSFSDGLPPNRTCPFSGHLGSRCSSWMPWGASAVDALVACAADDEGLAVACRHQPGPFRRVVPSLAVEVFECPDVVHLDLFPRSAQLALVGHEPFGDLGAVAPDAGGVVVEVGRTGGHAPSAPAQTAGRSEFLGLGSCMSTISTVLGGPDASARQHAGHLRFRCAQRGSHRKSPRPRHDGRRGRPAPKRTGSRSAAMTASCTSHDRCWPRRTCS